MRIAIWNGGAKGTVLLFPGRTEYIEKYGPVVSRLTGWGLNAVVIDWRGQGLSDRPISGKSIGFVENFAEYQDDLLTVLEADPVKALPDPRFVFCHSMGGCIALRALIDGLDVKAAVFSAPMYGIQVPLEAASKALISLGPSLGLGRSFAPGSGNHTYVSTVDFRDNVLTSDEPTFRRLQDHAKLAPELCLGGASFRWLHSAFREMAELESLPPPTVPSLTFLGDKERIVSPSMIRKLATRDANSELVICPGAEHEIWMERPEIQAPVWEKTRAFLAPWLDD
ncbi:alpha/beta fold hydrolase [Algicella marina]|uniref:alpha/beta fold hydrolase n=1 Tax=Algicella marina TaxID=2683284 RepID=UPI00137B446B|nr:alpha/beta hydrolase [Algicella marina]